MRENRGALYALGFLGMVLKTRQLLKEKLEEKLGELVMEFRLECSRDPEKTRFTLDEMCRVLYLPYMKTWVEKIYGQPGAECYGWLEESGVIKEIVELAIERAMEEWIS
jgi:hypothetical protein